MTPRSALHPADIAGIVFGLVVFAVLPFVPVAEAAPPNATPSIESVIVDATTVYPGDTCTMVCHAEDSDGDSLSYEWSATGGEIVTMDAEARWTAPARGGKHAILVQVTDGAGGDDTSSVTINVAENSAPDILALRTERSPVMPGERIRLECEAYDADGHPVTYEWSCISGEISASGPVAEWTAPSASGTHMIAVRARDGYGGERIQTVFVPVLQPSPPTIERLIVRPFLPEYSKQYEWGYRLLRGSHCECEIECVASADGKELAYEWATTAGRIEGEGEAILFVPPDTPMDVTVAVTVTEPFGQTFSAEAQFKVFMREAYSEETTDAGAGSCRCRG